MKFAVTALATLLAIAAQPACAGSVHLQWAVPGDPAGEQRLNAQLRNLALDADGVATRQTIESHLPPGAVLAVRGGAALAPRQFAGLGQLYTDARAVVVDGGGQHSLTDDDGTRVDGRRVEAGQWVGVRGRFRTLLVRADVPLLVDAVESVPDRPQVRVTPEGRGPVVLDFYAGPIDPAAFAADSPELGGMMYAALWEPLRWLASGLRWMLDRWQDLVGLGWLAIVLLSLTVKLLMAPLIAVAERWQADVNRIRSLLEPELAAVRREFRGEEAHNRTLAVYRRHGISHFYTVRSLAGFLIQIPVFIAAFDMLGENFRLSGERFLWIADLSAPDRFLPLPGVLPFFGGDLNLLPLVMTLATVLAARLQEDVSLAPELRQGQRLRLYAMAGLFLALLYTFPAGMVLYWTANNFWHLLRVLWSRRAVRSAG